MDERFAELGRDELVLLVIRQEGVVASQAAAIERLLRRVAELEAELGGRGSGRAVPSFVKANREKRQGAGERKHRAQGFVRRRDVPTGQVKHVPEQCQECGTALAGGSVKRRRQVLHVPLVAVEVIEHVYLERRCPVCGKRNVPKVDLGGEVVGKNRLSTDTMAMIASLREVGRLPLETIQWLLATFYRLKLSLGEIVRVLDTVAAKAAGTLAGLLGELRSSAVVHADETGWRQDGENGYLWSFSSERVHYVTARRSRAGEVVAQVLGQDFGGVLV